MRADGWNETHRDAEDLICFAGEAASAQEAPQRTILLYRRCRHLLVAHFAPELCGQELRHGGGGQGAAGGTSHVDHFVTFR